MNLSLHQPSYDVNSHHLPIPSRKLRCSHQIQTGISEDPVLQSFFLIIYRPNFNQPYTPKIPSTVYIQIGFPPARLRESSLQRKKDYSNSFSHNLTSAKVGNIAGSNHNWPNRKIGHAVWTPTIVSRKCTLWVVSLH